MHMPMKELFFIEDLTIVLAVSALVVILFRKINLPVVLGYILAGIVVGPYTLWGCWVTDDSTIQTLSNLGIIFLLFSIGLEFSIKKLSRVGFVAFVAAVIEIVLMIGIGFIMGRAFGWNPMDSIFLGAILSISSTTIIAKVLIEMKAMDEKFAHIIMGILIIEDVLAIVLISVLSEITSFGAKGLYGLGMSMLTLLIFVGVVVGAGMFLVPRFINFVMKFKSNEITIISAVALCLLVSNIAARLGFSVALGAFLIGAVIAEAKQSKEIVHQMEPLKDVFAAIFFVSVGMMIDPKMLGGFAVPIMIIALVTIIGKIISCSFGTFVTGSNVETSLRVGLGLAQIGEFSFIIARLGDTTDVTSPFLYSIAVCVSVITTITTPFLLKNSEKIAGIFHKRAA